MYRLFFAIAVAACLLTTPIQSVAQAHLSVERDTRALTDMGLLGGGAVSIWPLGTPFDPVRRYGLEFKGTNSFTMLMATAEPVRSWGIQLLSPAGSPQIYLRSHLDPEASGLDAKARDRIRTFIELYPTPERSLAPGLGAIVVYAIPRGVRSSSYTPYADRRMITDCHLRVCVVLAIDLDSDEALTVAEKQLALVQKEIDAKVWSHRSDHGLEVATAAQTLSRSAWAIESVLIPLRALNRDSFGGLVLSIGGQVSSPLSLSWVVSAEVNAESRAE